jgi:hypothetical protein
VDPGNVVPTKYFGFQQRVFNSGWQKDWQKIFNFGFGLVTVGNAKETRPVLS